MYCVNCRTEIKDGTVFCPKCGASQILPKDREKSAPANHLVKKKKHHAGGAAGMVCMIGIVCVIGIAATVTALFFSRGGTDEPQLPDTDTYSAAFHVYSCMDIRSDENGITVGEALPDATVMVRESSGNYSGEVFCTAEAQNGNLEVELPSGIYTLQFRTEGYLDAYTEVKVDGESAEQDIYVMPQLSENQTGIVLTWNDAEIDLDLTLLTPWQSTRGDMIYIGGNTYQDVYGNCLISDNKSRCETMLVNSGEEGTYRLYVNNYTDIVSGN